MSKIQAKRQAKLDPEILKELKRLNDHLRVKGEMHDFTSEASVSSKLDYWHADKRFAGSIFTSRGIKSLHTATYSEHHNTCYVDIVRPAVCKSAEKLRNLLKDRYPEQYEEWKLGTDAYFKKYPEKEAQRDAELPSNTYVKETK